MVFYFFFNMLTSIYNLQTCTTSIQAMLSMFVGNMVVRNRRKKRIYFFEDVEAISYYLLTLEII